MRRDSLLEQMKLRPHLKKLLQECWGCHVIGLKPGILKTKHGDYGVRDLLGRKFQELHLDSRGLCPRCVDDPPAEITTKEAGSK